MSAARTTAAPMLSSVSARRNCNTGSLDPDRSDHHVSARATQGTTKSMMRLMAYTLASAVIMIAAICRGWGILVNVSPLHQKTSRRLFEVTTDMGTGQLLTPW